jgi:hypothetical protein
LNNANNCQPLVKKYFSKKFVDLIFLINSCSFKQGSLVGNFLAIFGFVASIGINVLERDSWTGEQRDSWTSWHIDRREKTLSAHGHILVGSSNDLNLKLQNKLTVC